MIIYDKILLAMDNSDDSFRAAERIIEILKNGNNETEAEKDYDINTEVIAFHSTKHHGFPKTLPLSVPSSFGSAYTVPRVDYRKLKQEYRQHGEKILKKVRKLFEKNNLSLETRLIEDEKPEDYIKKLTSEEDIDLVALGCKGEHSKLKELLIGTVANDILNEVNTDLLIVR